MQGKPYYVLFLCTDNSAHDVLAEALIDHQGKGRFSRFKGYSAGSFPRGRVHPLALERLERLHLPTDRLRSKSWDEFARPDAPVMDLVFTVCDQAAGICPLWPGNPITARWGVPDPAAVVGSEAERRDAFRRAHLALETRIKLFVALPLDKLDRMTTRRRVDEPGENHPAREPAT
jgi:protein-tyrosine-phosphatase